ncbi:unnamed protein product [Symbiodinium natans]|uniref:DUF4203 domain-containing protein n=1 Tax=Symbiodinium natans TaxID=878477 RepID=A0A812PUI4_9DINO|nr:unnamed protein product [Symbiodinium natans]
MPHMPESTSDMRRKAKDLEATTTSANRANVATEASGLDNGSGLGFPCQDVYQFHSQVRKSPVLTYASHVSTWLAKSPHQAGIAVGAIIVGLLCAWDGPRVWQVLVITASSLGAAWLVHFEAVHKNMAPNLFAELLLMLATTSTVAMAMHIGFEGSQVLVGSFVGFVAAAYCSDWARTVDANIPGIALLWYCSGAILGTWVLLACRRALLSTVAPLFGSYLVVSGLGSLLSHVVSLPGLPQQGVWSLDAVVLLGPAGTQALVWHGVCALLAVSSHRAGRPILALALLVSYAAFVALGALLAGIQCHAKGKRADGTPCPAFLAVPGQWRWQLAGCTAWVILTVVSGWKQLVARGEGQGNFDSRARGIYMPVREVSTEDGLAKKAVEVDPLRTRLPSECQAGSLLPEEKSLTPLTPLTLSGFVHSIHSRRGGIA